MACSYPLPRRACPEYGLRGEEQSCCYARFRKSGEARPPLLIESPDGSPPDSRKDLTTFTHGLFRFFFGLLCGAFWLL